MATLTRQEASIAQLQSKIFQLKILKDREVCANEQLDSQLTSLQATHYLLERKQNYCIEQIGHYTNKMNQKEAQRNETRADYQMIQINVNNLTRDKANN